MLANQRLRSLCKCHLLVLSHLERSSMKVSWDPAWMCLCLLLEVVIPGQVPLGLLLIGWHLKKSSRPCCRLELTTIIRLFLPSKNVSDSSLYNTMLVMQVLGLSWKLWRSCWFTLLQWKTWLVFNGLAILPITLWALFNLNWTAFISEPYRGKLMLCCHSSVQIVGATSIPSTWLRIPKLSSLIE